LGSKLLLDIEQRSKNESNKTNEKPAKVKMYDSRRSMSLNGEVKVNSKVYKSI